MLGGVWIYLLLPAVTGGGGQGGPGDSSSALCSLPLSFSQKSRLRKSADMPTAPLAEGLGKGPRKEGWGPPHTYACGPGGVT